MLGGWWGGVGWGGVGWGGECRSAGRPADSDVNSKSAHATTVGIYSMFVDFAWVRHVPPIPSSS